MRPFQHLQVAALCRARARLRVPRAVICVRPLQYLEVATLRRAPARPLVPRATVRVKPFQRLELPKLCCTLAHRGVPLLPAGEHPLDDFDIPTLRGPSERVKVPPFGTVWPPQAFRTQPLQNLELATSRGDRVQVAHIKNVTMYIYWRGQKTILMQTFQHAYASDLRSLESIELLHFTPRRVHRVAHRATHRSKSGQIPGVG